MLSPSFVSCGCTHCWASRGGHQKWCCEMGISNLQQGRSPVLHRILVDCWLLPVGASVPFPWCDWTHVPTHPGRRSARHSARFADLVLSFPFHMCELRRMQCCRNNYGHASRSNSPTFHLCKSLGYSRACELVLDQQG